MINNIVSTLNDSDTTASLIDSLITSIDVQNGIIVLRGLEAGPGISLSIEDTVAGDANPQKIVISSTGTGSGQSYTGSNLGSSGESVFAGITNNDFTFKSLIAGNGIILTSDNNTITISAAPLPTQPPITTPSPVFPSILNIGTGLPIYAGLVNTQLQFNTIEAGNGITITNNNTGTLFVSANETNITSNTGGITLFNKDTNGNIEFKAFAAGNNVTITDGNIVTISASIPPISYTNLLNLPTIPQTLEQLNDVAAYPTDGQVLTWNQLTTRWVAKSFTGLTSIIQDTVPTLGGNLNVNGFAINSTGNIVLNATGNTVINSLKFPNIDGAPGQVLSTDGAHNLFWNTVSVGEINTVQNIGTGTGVFYQKVGTTLELQSLAAASNKIIIAQGTNTITFDIAESNLNLAQMSGILPISLGGTGSTDLVGLRNNLGFGSLSTQSSNNVTITGGIITVGNLTASGVSLNGMTFPSAKGTFGQVLTTDGAGNLSWQNSTASGGSIVSIISGGTGASDISTARSNLGLGNIAVQNANAVSIIGGNISGVSITNSSISTSSFNINGLHFPSNNGVAGQVLTTDGLANLTWTSLPAIGNIVNINNGGTGATDVVSARTNLGLGTLALQNANAVTISGGNISAANLTVAGTVTLNGISYPQTPGSSGQLLSTDGLGNLVWTTLSLNPIAAITNGGTGATDVISARTNLGLGSLATQNANLVSISGGSVNISALTVAGSALINGMQFPTNVGTANQVLTTDGFGNLSWASPVTNSVVSIINGGTGGTNPGAARTNLGLGNMALQNSSLISLTGGNISGVSITNSAVAATNFSANGTISLNNMAFPNGFGTANQVLTTNGSGGLSWTTLPTPSNPATFSLVTDTSPNLGGNLNLNGFGIIAPSGDMLLTAASNIHVASPLMISNGNFSVIGDACSLMAVLRAQTITATPTELFLDGLSARLVIPNNTTWLFNAKVVGRRIDMANAESAAFELVGCIDNSNGSSVIINQVTKIIVAHTDTNWDANASISLSANTLQIFVTGEAAKTIRWVAFVSIVEAIA